MNQSSKIFSIPVLVAALGYFVDIYDLQLFNLVSKESLGPSGLNLAPELIEKYDYVLFLWQMAGMLIGGIFFGILGDRLGRKSVLFGSILIYSIANIANGFVSNTDQYIIVRIIAGIGLSGELGAAITLVSEILHKETRGWGTMIIVATGAIGAVAANLIARNFSWQISYFVGGGLGLALLALRVGTFESGMFDKMKEEIHVRKGRFFELFRDGRTFLKYLSCILVGLPVWFVIGVLIKFSAKYHSFPGVVDDKVLTGNAIMYSYIGLSVGDLLSGALSQVFKTRRKVVFAYLALTIAVSVVFLYADDISVSFFYTLCVLLGIATGYWALFVTMAAEQFGTNIRATVTTTTPNFVRGAVIPIVLTYKMLQGQYGIEMATMIVGGTCLLLAGAATLYLKETFGKDLNYYETM